MEFGAIESRSFKNNVSPVQLPQRPSSISIYHVNSQICQFQTGHNWKENLRKWNFLSAANFFYWCCLLLLWLLLVVVRCYSLRFSQLKLVLLVAGCWLRAYCCRCFSGIVIHPYDQSLLCFFCALKCKAGMLTEMHTNRYMFVKKRKLSDCNFLFGKIHTFRFPFMWRDEMLTTCDAFSFQWKKKMMFSVKVYLWHMANGSAYGNVFSWMTTNS